MIRRLQSLSRSAVCLALGLLLVVLSAPVSALTNEQQQAFDRGVTYFNTEIDRCGDELGPNQATALGPKDASGHSLPAAKGGTGFEEEIDASGRVKSMWGKPADAGGYVTFSENVRKAPTEKNIKDPAGGGGMVSVQDLYRNYYITMRWRYVLWNWDGSSAGGAKETKDFYGKAPRVLVTNPENGKSIIAVVLEAGPAPWTGVLDPPNGVDYTAYANAHKPPYWEGPVDGTPLGYRGRVSGFPPAAIKALGAEQRQSSGLNGEAKGGDLIYSWAADQSALPGPTGAAATEETANGVNTVPCTAYGGAGIVNADGFAFPLDPQKKRDYTTLPCTSEADAPPGYHARGWVGTYVDRYGHRTENLRTCHHDHTPAFDLMYGGVEGKFSRAITDGTIVGMGTDYGGVQGCTEIQFQANQGKGGMFYWYGHQMKPKVTVGQHVAAGDPISQVATQHGERDYGSACYGGGPHLHIDRGCKNNNNVPQHGGNDECRDPVFMHDLQVIWNSLPEGQ